MKLQNKEFFFVAMANKQKKCLDWFVMNDNETINVSTTVNTHTQFKKACMSFKTEFGLKRMDDIIFEIQMNARQNRLPVPTTETIYQDTVGQYLLTITGPEVLFMNCSNQQPFSKPAFDVLRGEYVLHTYSDVTYIYNRESVFNQVIEDFYKQLENGEYLLYYLNEFRNQRRIPTLCLIGAGGSGKSTVLNHFKSYKPLSCKGFFSEKYTGDFGETSLIVEEESDESTSGLLTLNKIKDLQTTDLHQIRRMYENPSTARGFATILFSANKNTQARLMNLLNSKGEDVESIKRRVSTFYFSKENSDYLKDGDKGNPLNVVDDITNDVKVTTLDAHLNYLEDTGFFKQDKFKKTTPLYLLVHSPTIDICSRLSQNDGLLLEELYDYFGTPYTKRVGSDELVKTTLNPVLEEDVVYKEDYMLDFRKQKDGDEYTFELQPIEKALIQSSGGNQPGEMTVRKRIEFVAPECFEVKRSNGRIHVVIKSLETLTSIYNRHVSAL